MAIDLQTRKRLWCFSGNECAHPDCKQPLLAPMASDEHNDMTLGKECHIVADSDDGPRGPNSLSDDECNAWSGLIADRDGFDNLLLMCGVHHDVIDQDPATYTVEALVKIKTEHLSQVLAKTSDEQSLAIANQLRIAEIVDGWSARVDLDWLSNHLAEISFGLRLEEEWFDRFEKACVWLLERPWPEGFDEIRISLTNFRLIAQDLVNVVSWYGTRRDGYVMIDHAYKETGGAAPQDTYDFLVRRHEYSIDLSRDLAFQLTCATNMVCEKVRAHLWPTFRLSEGNVIFQAGMAADFTNLLIASVYEPTDASYPYPGLDEFVVSRASGFHFGEGRPGPGFSFPGVSKVRMSTSTAD